jgi:EAL domain-containing protein (putative c-di-GMP-specific phosphodiesterase class I)
MGRGFRELLSTMNPQVAVEGVETQEELALIQSLTYLRQKSPTS